jgi:hypothetical protein
MKRRTTLALAAASLLCLGVSLAPSHALASTMTLSYLWFPTAGTTVPAGTSVPCLGSTTVPNVMPGTTSTNMAPMKVYCDVAGQPMPVGFTFLFWNAAAVLEPNLSAPCTAPSDNSNFSCTAWYVEDVGGPATLVTTYAFSLNQNQVLAGQTPIATVTPTSAQTSPTMASTAMSAVQILAKTQIGGFGRWKSWVQFGGNVMIAGSTISAPLKGGGQAIAFYGVPVPDPCADLKAQLASLNPADFPTFQGFEDAARELGQQIRSCERAYGESP